MEICSICGNKSLLPEFYNAAVLCKKCSLKLLSPTWKNKNYTSNEEVEKQKNSTIHLARRNGFDEKIIKELELYFDNKKVDGLYKIVDGGNGQKITVCDKFCIIETTNTFDYKETNKTFKRVMSGKRGVSAAITDYVSPEVASTIINGVVGSVVPGKGLIKNGLKQVGRSMAVNAFVGENNGSQVNKRAISLNVNTGKQTVNYIDYDFVQFIGPVGEEEHGFLLFQNGKTQNDFANAVVFSCNATQKRVSETSEICEYIQNKMNTAQREVHNHEQESASTKHIQGMQAAEEILKYKELLDVGAITQEEFELKKKQLLGI